MTSASTMAIPVPPQPSRRRGLVTVAVMLATIMQALDTTIANVALPHMQGSMSATQDQISWVLTSYIVAAAICLPMIGFLADTFGRKRLFVWSVIGFTLASMLCGAAQNLPEMVVFRLLQGVFGAALVPLSQSVLLDTYPREKHASAMAMWGFGVMLGPILGPSLGGWLTEFYSWRWVFYINLPFGILAIIGIATFVKETPLKAGRQFDLLGFAFLSLGLASLQLMLDRGESQDWFSSREILVEAILAALGFYWFVVHIFTAKNTFIEPAIFKDRNFATGILFIFIVGIILLATMAILPPFLQNLLGYPVIDVGLVMAPRGLGVMIAMLIVGRLAGRVDPRAQVGFGLLLTAFSLWQMTRFTLDIGYSDIIISSVVQGFGLGCVFVPLSTITFATLDSRYRNEGTAFYSLSRNIGSSIGISVVISQLQQSSQKNHAVFADYLTPVSVPLKQAIEAGVWDLGSARGLAMLNSEVSRQAAALAYLQDFRLMMWIALFALPLVFCLRVAKK